MLIITTAGKCKSACCKLPIFTTENQAGCPKQDWVDLKSSVKLNLFAQIQDIALVCVLPLVRESG